MNPNDDAFHAGTWLGMGSPVAAELAALAGFDWVLLDLEHGCESEAALPGQLRALRGSRTRPVVRVGAPHADLVARVLDWGAAGIMVPRVNDAREAEQIVQAARYAPRGRRGYSRTVRAHDYGLRTPDEAAPPLVMAQVETAAGVQQAREIAGVDGIDVLFVGPADLQHDLAHRGAQAPGDYARCLELVCAAANEAGKASGILVRELSQVRRHRDLGFTYVAVDSDVAILRKAYQEIVSAVR